MARTIDDLVVGDFVVVIYAHGTFGISEIAKVTKTQVTTHKGSRYNKSTGTVVGGNIWNMEYINPALDVDDYRTRIKKYQAIRDLKKFIESIEVLKFDHTKIDITEVVSMREKLEGMVR